MTRPEKLYQQLLASTSRRISFRDLETLLAGFGFERKRTRGSHRSYKHPGVPEVVTIQPRGKDALPYQVERLLELIRDYGLHIVK